MTKYSKEETTTKHIDVNIRESSWLLNLLSPHLSYHNRFITVLALTCLLPIVMIVIARFVDHNHYLVKPAVGLFQDWNILFMFVTYPIALVLLNNVCNKFNAFIKELPGAINISISYDDDVSEISTSISNIVRTRNAKWKTIKVALFACGFIFVYFNAYNRYFRSEKVTLSISGHHQNIPLLFGLLMFTQ